MAAYPASLTKMMTLYLTFSALNEGRLSLDQRVPVSAHAAAQAPSKLWLKPGDSVPVQALILALVTRSANDAAVVLAEALAGSETDFAERMTETARRLGMNDTNFRNASGLPDPLQRTTARDLARLSLALYQDFPREYAYFSIREFEFRGQTITTHNHMLNSYEGSDGIKTGFMRASGFNLAASAERYGHRLIGVVLGSPSWPVRDKEMAALFDRGFAVARRDARRQRGHGRTGPRTEEALRVRSLGSPPMPCRSARRSRPPRQSRKSAPAVNTAPAQAEDDWDRTIQLGAFPARADAARLARTASRLKPAQGQGRHRPQAPRRRAGAPLRGAGVRFHRPGRSQRLRNAAQGQVRLPGPPGTGRGLTGRTAQIGAGAGNGSRTETEILTAACGAGL